jgi:ABC-2 type transport system ATP-binding protein
MSDVRVELRSVRKVFGSTIALDGISCEVGPGEIVGLLGPNGAGKTTTLRILLGMIKPTSGNAKVDGIDCTADSRSVKKRLGYTPDEPAFYDFLTGRETVDFVLRVRGLDPSALWPTLLPIAERLDFEEKLDAAVGGYSHGMKKKLAVLVALAHAPGVLLLDEPTNGLDPLAAAKVREILRERAKEGVAVLVSTHLLDMADRMCDRILVLHGGHLVAEGTPEAVRARAGVEGTASLEAAFLKLVG